jgi:N-acetylated-alpha-linked acidic dipeptidase
MNRKTWKGAILCLLVVAVILPASLGGRSEVAQGPQAPAAIRGFTPERAEAQRALEEKLQRIPSPESAEKHLRFLTSEPHMAGTDGSRRVAEYIRDRFRSYGLETEMKTYKVWLPQPKEVRLELIFPEKKSLATQEDPYDGDKDTHHRNAVIGFNGFSASGEVKAEVVYVNYGLPEDYQRLRELGVRVEGKIALARYGRSFRGIKALVAQENKAVGLIIYSDPFDDGYMAGDAYPRGPYRPSSGIQRGSVYYGVFYPGDPLTPGVAATEDAKRLDPAEAKSLPRIPVMPINYRDASEILSRLNGPRVPREWQGGLPFTYHIGPGKAAVHLKVEMDYQLRAIYDPIARIRGQNDDQWVIVGNHHDAWVFGAVDPSSGTTTMLEMARALGELVRSGWKPRRTIILACWDAEEYGLIGSTEWVEEHRDELRRKAVAYINVDSAVSGPNFGSAATPSLRAFVREAVRMVSDPQTGKSVYDAWKDNATRGQARRRSTAGTDSPASRDADVPLGVLGSGSDFTAFYQHVGIPSLDFGFGGEYGVYHSIYDNFFWMKNWGDPNFAYHATAARVLGVLTTRMAEADVLPFDYETYAAEMQRYVGELQKLVAENENGQLDLKPVIEAAATFADVAARAQKAIADPTAVAANPSRAVKINRALVEAEQALLAPSGLSDRPWYRHTIFAPGKYAGYAAVLLPGVREAVDRGDWAAARSEAAALADALRRAAVALSTAVSP